MAGVLKVRDTDGTLRTITTPKVRDVDGTLRTLQFIRVRDDAGVLREGFTAGGGGGGANPASITPGSRSFSGTGPAKSGTFTLMSSGATPTSYNWGLLDGAGSVVAGQGTANATLQVTSPPDDYVSSTFFCDAVIGGVTYRATCVLEYYRSSGGGGGVGGPIP